MTLQEKIADAKSWYQQETKGTVNYLQSTRKDSILINNEPLWDKVRTEVLTDQTLAIVVPVKTNLYDIARKNGELNLVISYNEAGRDFKLLNRFKVKNTDTTLLTTLELYNLAFAKEQENSIMKTKILTVSGDKQLSLRGQNLSSTKFPGLGGLKDKIVMTGGCTHHYWVEKHWVDGQVVSEDWSYMYSTGCGGNGGAPEEQYPTPGEGGPETPPQGTPLNIDTSLLKDPKASCVLMKLLGVPQFNHFIAIFKGQGFDLKFQVKTTLDHTGSRGETKHSTVIPNLFEINLRKSFVDSASPIYIAKTLLHEAFHANLMQKAYEIFGSVEINNNWVKKPEQMELNELVDIIESKVTGTSLQDVTHEYMANKISTLTDALYQFAQDNDSNFPNYDGFDFMALAWDGLRDTTYYKDNVKNNQLYYVPNTTLHMQADSLSV